MALAGKNRANTYLVCTVGDHLLKSRNVEFLASGCNGLSIDDNIASKNARNNCGVEVVQRTQRAVHHFSDGDFSATFGATVNLANDHVLGHIHQTTGQVTRVSGTKRSVSETLTSTVG